MNGDVAAATRRLYESIRANPAHRDFIRAVDTAGRSLPDDVEKPLIAIAPAALYREYRHSGADGRRLREAAESLGLRVETIPLEPAGTLATNAAILASWLRRSSSANVVLISLSKGSSDVKKALATEPDAFAGTRAWLSVGGLLEGTPLVEWLLSDRTFPRMFRALNRLNGVDFAFLQEVDRRKGGPLDFDFAVPPHIRVMHLLGFALPEHASNWLARTLYRRLEADGPNDGFMLLEDAVRWPGAIYPLWGADHYFRTREDPRPLIERLLCVAVQSCQ